MYYATVIDVMDAKGNSLTARDAPRAGVARKVPVAAAAVTEARTH